MDDLCRIVIPKEICRSMGLKGGDAIEFFTSETGDSRMMINLVKYSTGFKDDFKNLTTQIVDEMSCAEEYKLAKEFRDTISHAFDILKKFENRD